MKEKNLNILKKAIDQLPSLNAPEGSWEGVEQKLKVQNSINDLPEFKAPEYTWERIEKELDKATSGKRKNTIRLVIRSCAAAIILMVALYAIKLIVGYRGTDQDVLQKFRTEMPEMNKAEDAGFESLYNPSLCRSNPQVCNTPLFKSLDNELYVIKAEIEEMKPMVKGGDPQLMKYYYRLVNERAEIEKRMVKLIMQT